MSNILVSAIVSVYNSEKFIRECLENLVTQSLYEKGKLEIVVVNSGSQEGEDAIIKEYELRYANIKYIHTGERESIYKAWNRGIKAASGKYITNANTDDRHHKKSLEYMAAVMEQSPEIGLVYANQLVTETPNDKLDSDTSKSLMRWSDFDKDLLFFGCFMGPQPMWKKELHEKHGYFDEELKVVGDYEFWLRISRDTEFKHIDQVTGLYLHNPVSAERRDPGLREKENDEVRIKYMELYAGSEEELTRIIRKALDLADSRNDKNYRELVLDITEKFKARKQTEKTNQNERNGMNKQEILKQSEILIEEGNPEKAGEIITSGLREMPGDSELLNNMAVVYMLTEEYGKAAATLNEIITADPADEIAADNLATLEKVIDEKIAEVKLLQAEEHIGASNYKEARELLEEILKTYPENINALNDLSVVDILENKLEDGVKKISAVIDMDPSNKVAAENLGVLENMISKTT